MDESLEEWLSNNPIEWDYWQYLEDFVGLREWYGAQGAQKYYYVEKWYETAEKYDAEQYHNHSLVDFSKWQNPFWTIHQATALLLGKDPNLIDAQRIEKDKNCSIFAWYYWRLCKLIAEAQAAGKIPDPIRPRIVIEWAASSGIRYPDGMENVVSDDHTKADDYEWLYKSALDQIDLLRTELNRTRQELSPNRSGLSDSLPETEPLPPSTPRIIDKVKEAILDIWGADFGGVRVEEARRKINRWLEKRDCSTASISTIQRARRELRKP